MHEAQSNAESGLEARQTLPAPAALAAATERMDQAAQRETRRLRMGAVVLALLIALAPPALQSYFGARAITQALQYAADSTADDTSALVSVRPDTWRHELNALQSLLEKARVHAAVSGAVLRDESGSVIAAAGGTVASAVFVRAAPVLDSGVQVATVTLHRNGTGLVAEVAHGAALGLVLGLLTWWLVARRALARLETTIGQLQRARIDAERAGRARTAFLATMSHEIRTPMNGVIGMTSLLQGTSLSPTQRHHVEVIRSSGDALLTVINDILEFTKIESADIALEPQRFQPESLAHDVLALLEPAANGNDVELACRVAPDMPEWVTADATRLRQVLVNIVANAVKFTKHGEVLVSVDCPAPERIRFTVRDTGIGMTAAQIATVFDPFVQADASTTRRFGGTGLGLTISRRLAQLMGGEVRIHSTPGQGSTVVVEIAAALAEAPPEAGPAASLDSLLGMRVLLVDDNQTNLEILQTLVRGWGMQPQALSDPRAALALLREGEAFDLAVLDFNMPHLDGAALARELRAVQPTMPMVLLSSSEGAPEAHGLFAARLHKPIRRRLLLETVLGVLGDDAAAHAAALSQTVPASLDAARERHALRVLVVEDNPVNAIVVRTMLERMGYSSDLAGSGVEAIEAMQRQGYDLVLMDMLMPEMDGLEATRRIRAMALVPQPRIVALTANVMQEDREACHNAGMDDFLAKPFTLVDLQRCLAAFART